MSLLTLTSTNPLFSHIITKNPATIAAAGKPFQRELRQGQLYGWFMNENASTFRLWFKDHPTKSSFAQDCLADFEYLDKTRYASPYLPIMMIQTALSTATKGGQDIDYEAMIVEGDDHPTYFDAIVTTTIRVPALRLFEQLCQHYAKDVRIESEEVDKGYYEIKVIGRTVYKVLNVLQVICVLMAMRDDDSYVRLDKHGVEKYLRVLNNSNAPYYVRYVFGSRAITNRAMFEELKGQLQAEGMTLFYGDTRQQRYDAITSQLNKKGTLYDIGCGEMFYAFRLKDSYDTIFAIDADEETAKMNAGKVAKRKIETIESIHAKVTPEWVQENLQEGDDVDVLITEVLEHMPLEDANALLQALLQKDVRSIVATVPNANFNQNYGLGEEFRHDDHHYEPTFEDWSDYTVTMAAKYGWQVKNVPIGDVVNDQSVSTMSVFFKE